MGTLAAEEEPGGDGAVNSQVIGHHWGSRIDYGESLEGNKHLPSLLASYP